MEPTTEKITPPPTLDIFLNECEQALITDDVPTQIYSFYFAGMANFMKVLSIALKDTKSLKEQHENLTATARALEARAQKVANSAQCELLMLDKTLDNAAAN